MTNKKRENWISLTGCLAAVFYFLHIYFGQSAYPDYSWMRQAVSDLTATGSPSYIVATRYSSLYGLFSCISTLVLCIIVNGSLNRTMRIGIYLYAIMNLISNVGYTLFPLSGSGYNGHFADFMHAFVVTSGVVLLSIISLTFIGIGGFMKSGNKTIAIFGIITLLSLFVGSIGMKIVPAANFGIFERVCVFSVVIYTFMLGMFGFLIGSESPNTFSTNNRPNGRIV